MIAVLRASLSLDGKLLDASGRPLGRSIPISRIKKARELKLTIHPLIVGGGAVPTLSALPEAFLPEELRWELLSAENGRAGTIVTRYRRK
jgi:hypothetical protein